MAVAIDATGTEKTSTTGVTSFDFTGITVGSGSNRGLVFCVNFDSRLVSSITATWDNGGTNQAMTLLVGPIATAGSNGAVAVFGLANPTAGNKTLHVAWTTSSPYCADAVSFTGVDQTGGTTSFPHATSATGNSTTPSVTVTSAAGNAVVACHTSAASGTISATNNTNIYIDNGLSGTSNAMNRASGAATVTMTATDSASGQWASAGTDILAAAVATPVLNLPRRVFLKR